MAPEVKIHPIKQMYGIFEKEEHSRTVAILCSSFGVQEAKVPIPHIVDIFDNADREIPGRSLSAEAANRIAGFIRNIRPEMEVVCVYRDAGNSRSSAIATVCRCLGISDSPIWEKSPVSAQSAGVSHALRKSGHPRQR